MSIAVRRKTLTRPDDFCGRRNGYRASIDLVKRIFLILFVILLCSCKRESRLVLLVRNLHPGMAQVELRVSIVPRGRAPAASEHLLWTGNIPHNADPMHFYTKTIPLSGAGVPEGTDCCVRIELKYQGETFSDGSGSWKPGKNLERITIENQNGGYYVKHEGPDEPEDFDKYRVLELP